MTVTPESLQEAFGALALENNGGNDYDRQKQKFIYTDPTHWFVVDKTTAEPEVNWPGELVSMHDNHKDAVKAFWTAVLARASVNGATERQLQAGLATLTDRS